MVASPSLAAIVRGTAHMGEPTLVLMHFLGGSAREWDEVIPLLGDHQHTVALDLPGFGDSADIPGYTVAEMADAVEATLGELALAQYILVGHSMSGKVAAVMASRARERSNSGLVGLILIAPSPPGPEPMTEEKRSGMIGLLGERHTAAEDWTRARTYVTKNDRRDLAKPVEDRAIAEVLRMNRSAWVAWVERGSREDWAERVGVIDLPTLIVAGEKDESLGAETQCRVTLPHFRQGHLACVKNCSHLVPMEKPQELAGLMRGFVEQLRSANKPGLKMPVLRYSSLTS